MDSVDDGIGMWAVASFVGVVWAVFFKLRSFGVSESDCKHESGVTELVDGAAADVDTTTEDAGGGSSGELAGMLVTRCCMV